MKLTRHARERNARRAEETVCLLKAMIIHLLIIHVHRCGTGGSMRACHEAGPGSISGWNKFPG